MVRIHHIWSFTSHLLFWNLFSCMYWFGLLHNKKNTFNDIVINNLTKLCNMTCACFYIQNHIFQTQPSFYFWKDIILYAQLWFWWIQTLSKFSLITQEYVIINTQKNVCLNKKKKFQLHLPPEKSKCSNVNKSHNMIIIF